LEERRDEMYGWRGTILRVNLSNEEIIKQPLNESVARDFIGGRGFNSKTLFEEVKPGIDPLSSENVLCLAPVPAQPLVLHHVPFQL